MSLSYANRPPYEGYNPAVIEVELFCKGLRIDSSCTLGEDGRLFLRTRAGLGSGLELILPAYDKEIWVNIPVEEDFASTSPYRLLKHGASYILADDREPHIHYDVRIPSQPKWYDSPTGRGIPMSKVGVLQGTYLGIYIGQTCAFWCDNPRKNCKFCATGLNVGVNEVVHKTVDDVVQTALAAKEESGVTFVHFNSGDQGGRGLDIVAPYVKAVKERVGALVGVQVMPTRDLWKYDWLLDLGADHFSFCYEFHNPEYFQKFLPGKHATVGQQTFFRAMEYTAKKMGKGRNSGEIIAGIEPVEDTFKAIDYITSVGCFPTVCIFRPVIGSDMEHYPSPRSEEMIEVMRHVYESCMLRGIPTGMAPNIEVSLIVNPDDAKYLSPPSFRKGWYELKRATIKRLAAPMFERRMRPRPISTDANDPSAYRPKG
jgi:hypothetical protein